MKIETERLIVQPLQLKDRHAMHGLLLDFEKSEYRLYDYKPPTELEKIEMLIRYWVRSNKYFTLTLKETAQIIGFICIEGDEIGFNIKTEFHRRGYGYEATRAFVEYMTEKRRIRRFTAQAALENTPSVTLLKKLGFVMKSAEEIQFRRNYPPVMCGIFELEI